MTKESKEAYEYSLEIEKGILLMYPDFKCEANKEIQYDFDCKEYEVLKSKYKIKKIAGKGSDFERAKRLLNYFSPRLKHNSYYDNHIECNSLALLEYSFGKPEHGINCLNKAKIFSEVCLAVGIKARRVVIYPLSPYDLDNHVVTEIFDKDSNKWIMMDPTTQGLFIGKDGEPLSMLGIRNNFANNEFVTFIKGNEKVEDTGKLKDKYLYKNWYICKNSFRFSVQSYQGFGSRQNDWLDFVPQNYSVKNFEIRNANYRIKKFSKDYPEFAEDFKKMYEQALQSEEPLGYSINCLY